MPQTRLVKSIKVIHKSKIKTETVWNFNCDVCWIHISLMSIWSYILHYNFQDQRNILMCCDCKHPGVEGWVYQTGAAPLTIGSNPAITVIVSSTQEALGLLVCEHASSRGKPLEEKPGRHTHTHIHKLVRVRKHTGKTTKAEIRDEWVQVYKITSKQAEIM